MLRAESAGLRRVIASICILVLLCTLTSAFLPSAHARPSGGAADGEGSSASSAMIDFLFKSVTGWVLLVIYFAFIALAVWLLLDLRVSSMLPTEFIETFEEALNKRRYKEAFEMAKADGSMMGRVMTAGMTRLQHGLQEARDAGGAMIHNLKSRKDHILSYLAIIGTLGPLIGLVGTVSGMITSFAELGGGGTPKPAELAKGISHALNATLVGIFLSCMAIPAYSYFKNRLSRITNDLSLMVDDLLTQMYHSSRRPADGAATTTAATTTKPAAQPTA